MNQSNKSTSLVKAPQVSLHHLIVLFHRWFRQLAVPEDSLDKIYGLCRNLPVVSGIIIEKHLSDPDDQTDFSLRISGDTEEKNSFCNYIKGLRHSTCNAAWQPVYNLMSAWCTNGSVLNRSVEHVWLEFDIPPGENVMEVPSLFFDIDPFNKLPLLEKERCLFKALASLNNDLSLTTKMNVARCLHHLPPGAGLHYAGIMLPRNTGFVRLCMKELTGAQISVYLDLLGWKGNKISLQNALSRYAGNAKKLVLHIDVNENVYSGAGVEFHFENEEDWPLFFDLLVTDKIIEKEEACRLLAYPGFELMPESEFKQHLSQGCSNGKMYIIRRLNHVKLTFAPTGTITAKAYIYACYHVVQNV